MCFPNPECVVRKPVKGFGSCCGMGPLFNWYARRRGRRHCRPFDWPRTRSAAARKSMPLFLFSCQKKTKTRKKVPPDSWRSETRRRHSSGFLLFFFLATRPTWNTPAECVLLLADVLRSATRWSQQKKRERERVKRPARDLHCFVFGFGLFFWWREDFSAVFFCFKVKKRRPPIGPPPLPQSPSLL